MTITRSESSIQSEDTTALQAVRVVLYVKYIIRTTWAYSNLPPFPAVQMASESANLDYLSLHPFVRSTVVEKVRGTLIGSALGDAVGLYTGQWTLRLARYVRLTSVIVEFLSKQQATEAYDGQSISLIPPVTPFFGDGHRDKFVEVPSTSSESRDDPLLTSIVLLDRRHGP